MTHLRHPEFLRLPQVRRSRRGRRRISSSSPPWFFARLVADDPLLIIVFPRFRPHGNLTYDAPGVGHVDPAPPLEVRRRRTLRLDELADRQQARRRSRGGRARKASPERPRLRSTIVDFLLRPATGAGARAYGCRRSRAP